MKSRAKPQRRCVGCREMRDKPTLIRIVRGVAGGYFIDTTTKACGRGAYLCKSVDCFKKAVKQRSFERSFKAKIDNSIYEDLEKMVNNE